MGSLLKLHLEVIRYYSILGVITVGVSIISFLLLRLRFAEFCQTLLELGVLRKQKFCYSSSFLQYSEETMKKIK